MAKPNKVCKSSTKDNAKNKNSSNSGVLNPHNMFWAVKYHDDGPDEIVIVHFDDGMMKALNLDKKTTTQ